MLKNLLITSVIAFSVSAAADLFNCTQNEAQFFGTVKNTGAVDPYISDCVFEIEFSHFQSSMVCPLKFSAAINAKHYGSCAMKDGDTISGILVEKNGDIYIE